MWRRLAALAMLSVMALSASACAQDEVTVALDWFPNANHTGLYLAMERGYFKDEGIALKVYTPDDPATILATVGSDKDEFGFEYQVGVLLARAQGVPVVSIAGIVQHPLNSVMALQESGITRPRDLVGRTVGYPGIATDPPLLRTMLEFDGVPPEQAQAVVDGMVNVGFDLIPALISKRVDAVVGAYWTHESISAQNQGFPVVVMRMEEWGVPDFYELVLVTSERNAANGVGAGAALRASSEARLRGGGRRPPGGRRDTAAACPGGGPQDRPSGRTASGPSVGGGGGASLRLADCGEVGANDRLDEGQRPAAGGV